MTNKILTLSSEALGESYSVCRHPSGLNIYVFPKKMTSTYAVFATKYGSTDNIFKTDGEDDFITVPDGIAHFLEHKLFTNEDGSDSFERFSDYGADANAYTSFNKTAYLFSCTENFEDSLRELISFVTNPYFTEDSVAKERGIIAQEIRMYDDSPSDRCFYGMLEGMYTHHSVKRNICGTVSSIKKITAELLYDCYRVFYDLSNMALIVCGDVDTERVIKIADELLPAVATGKSIIRSSENSREKRRVNRARVERKMSVSKPMFCIGVKDTDIPTDARARHKKDAAMSILDEMLFSRCTDFYNSLIDREIMSPSFSYGYTVSEEVAYNSFAGESDTPDAVLDEIKRYIAEVRQRGLSHEDFLRARRVMYAEYVKIFDSTESIANNLLSFVLEGADIFDYGELLRSVTIEDVERLFEAAFDDECFTMSVVYPINENKGE